MPSRRPARLVALPLDDRITPAITYQWTGSAGDNLFSTAGNWTKLGDAGQPLGPAVPPTDGSAALLFPDKSKVNSPLDRVKDDLGGGADVTFDSITTQDHYVITDTNGGRTVLLDGATTTASATLVADLRLAGPTTLTASGLLSVQGDVALAGNRLTVAGGGAGRINSVGGTGDVFVAGRSDGGIGNVNFAGTLSIEAGSKGTVTGRQEIGPQVAITGGGWLVLEDYNILTTPIALSGPDAAFVVRFAADLKAGAIIPPGVRVFGGSIQLFAPDLLPPDVILDIRPALSYGLDANGYPVSLSQVTGGGGDLAQINQSKNADVVAAGAGSRPFDATVLGAGRVVVRGPGTTTFTRPIDLRNGAGLGDEFVVESGTAVLGPTAIIYQDARLVGGVLSGNGRLDRLVVDGGTLMPGQPNSSDPLPVTGKLTMNAGGTLRAEVLPAGRKPVVIDVGSAPTLAGTLRLTVPAGVGNGDVIELVHNGTFGVVSGTFAGLPEGATVLDETGRYAFRISYVGGDGNDVTLTEVGVPAAVAAVGPGAFDVSFARPVTGFEAADVLVTAGAGVTGTPAVTVGPAAPTGDGGVVYRVTVGGLAGQGPVSVRVPAGAAADAGGVPTREAAADAAIDKGPLTVSVSTPAPDPATVSPVPVTIAFSKPVTGFTAADVLPAAGTEVTDFAAVSATTYTALLRPTFPADRPGTLGFSLPAGAAVDAAGNPSQPATFARAYVPPAAPTDTTPPTVSFASPSADPTALAAIPVAVVFSEPVTGFTADDLSVTNGTVTGFAAVSATEYRLTLVPAAPGRAALVIPAGAATDAAGNPNPAASFARTYAPGTPAGSGPPLLVGIPQYGFGAAGTVRLLNPDGSVRLTATPFPAFGGSLRAAAGDFNNDGFADLAVGTGPGTLTQFRVLDGRDPTGRTVLFAQAPFGGFGSGLYLTAGDVTGDGVADLVITPDRDGGPRVKVIRGGGVYDTVADFIGIGDPDFRDGAVAAVGDLTGDGIGDILVTAGVNGGPRAALYDGLGVTGTDTPPKLVGDFFALDPNSRAGAYVALGDVDGDGVADPIFGSGPGAAPRVRILSGADVQRGVQTVIADFAPAGGSGGAPVAVKDLDGDRFADVLVGATAPAAGRVTAFAGAAARGANPPVLFADDANAGFTGGVFVG
jgi:hypothetical protein